MPAPTPPHAGPLPIGLLALALLQAALPATLRAQDDAPERRGGGYFQAGLMVLDTDELNAALLPAGYPALDDSFLTLGGGGFGMSGRFLIGGEGHAVIGGTETTPDGTFQLGLGGGYGLFRLGYLAYSIAGVDVYPMIGLGGGGVSLSLIERSAPTFGDVLLDPARSAHLSAGAFLVDASVAVFYRPEFATTDGDGDRGRGRDRDDDEDRGGLLLGLQGGYTFSPADTSWRLDGINTVAGGPDMNLQGFYVRLSIGGWGG